MKNSEKMAICDESMNIVIVGHVDHGKSTVLGRLLADTGSLPEGKLEQVKELCRKTSKPFEYAFLLDALKDEREQGITIDTARCFFRTKKRKYIIIDAPGHIEFLKNMVTGAAGAEAALLVIDANEGVMDNTIRHGYMLSMLGIKSVAVLINKMDLVSYRQDVFDSIKENFTGFLISVGVNPLTFIPVSGMRGDNIAEKSGNMLWYNGNTVLEMLDSLESVRQPVDMPFRMYVQGVYKFTANGDDRRIVAGTIETGRLKIGDEVIFNPSGKKSRVKSIESFMKAPQKRAEAGWATGFTLEKQIYIPCGELVSIEGETQPYVSSKIRASVFWLGWNDLEVGKNYIFRIGTFKTTGRVQQFLRIVNSADLSVKNELSDVTRLETNDAAECIIELDRPASFDIKTGCDATGRFVIIDDYEVAGGGIIRESLKSPVPEYASSNIFFSEGKVTEEDRSILFGHKGLVVWLTGLSGAGKSTLAIETEKALVSMGKMAYRLDGDNIRHGLNSDLGFSNNDREENIRRIAEVAVLFKDAGIITLVSCISPLRIMREKARALIKDGMFIEIYVKADLQTCIKRDVKGLYQKALKGRIDEFTGVSAPYEVPYEPDLILDTEIMDVSECTAVLTEKIIEITDKRNGGI